MRRSVYKHLIERIINGMLAGASRTTRYQNIEAEYFDINFDLKGVI